MDAITQIVDKIKENKPEIEIISDIIDLLYLVAQNQIKKDQSFGMRTEDSEEIKNLIKKIGRQIKS